VAEAGGIEVGAEIGEDAGSRRPGRTRFWGALWREELFGMADMETSNYQTHQLGDARCWDPLPGHRVAVYPFIQHREAAASMTARRSPPPWCVEELDECVVVPAVPNVADIWDWIGSVLLCALAVLTILLFGFL
jgi:hypothetical protein